MKTIERQFVDWEKSTLGFGYGTGDPFIWEAVKSFLVEVPEEGNYDSQKLEDAVTPTVAWLLINLFCRAEMIEYGTSPRGGWLTDSGKALQHFVKERSVEDILKLLWDDDIHCDRDFCNCDDGDCRAGNVFWKSA